ncbi:S26 family signal peptidase [Phenylobacterium sp. SCN 70-31]|uniref:S26 family signal peptidase n=1 Tax=Phenylobacterium sp. SCN 70-31 TaxID=1660129 RepID=UPI0025D6312C|nr:S26 family signal peptidase [Phenylobacterium sp. SCN 70-31]
MTRGRILLALVVVTASGGTASWLQAQPTPWLINETDSLPRGVYLRTAGALRIGVVVAAAPPMSARSYLDELGASADARLLKRIAAGPGEEVCRDGARVSWPRGAVVARVADRRGRALPTWSGCRRLTGDEFLLLGDTATSFDSRYFGPAPRAAIHGIYKEVWRW